MKCTGWADGPCDSNDAVRYKMRTSYVNEESNFAVLCPECQKECASYWDQMWSEYYGGVMCGVDMAGWEQA